jgi:hypothetical protein
MLSEKYLDQVPKALIETAFMNKPNCFVDGQFSPVIENRMDVNVAQGVYQPQTSSRAISGCIRASRGATFDGGNKVFGKLHFV